jgi:outer membrane protein assembly factor BamE (lipoprotein component of BamABCDE complex)
MKIRVDLRFLGQTALKASAWLRVTAIVIMVGMVVFSGCATTGTAASNQTNASGLTHGNVQLTLKKGETTQNEVLEVFGPPNIVTYDADGQEVWTYQRHATVSSSQSSSAYGTIILIGGSSRTSGFEQSSRTMTLIIKFDEDKKVSDFRSRASTF